MERHLKVSHGSLHKIVLEEKLRSKDKPDEQDEDQPITLVVKMSVKSLKAALVEIITVNGRPFAYMEDSGLQKILRPYLMALPPALRFRVSADSVKNLITDTANAIITDLRDELKNRKHSLKIDAVSRLNRSFFGINAQFIEGDRIAVRTLAVTELLVRHTGVNLKRMVMETLDKYGIEPKNVYSVTSDNGSNMLKASELLREMQVEQLVTALEVDMENAKVDDQDPFLFTQFEVNGGERSLYVIPCPAYILQLAVLAFLKLGVIKKLLDRVRKIVNSLRNQNNLNRLRNTGLPIPVLDVVTRWHSAVDMLISFVVFKVHCDEFQIDFSAEDWVAVEALITCLEQLKIATKIFESEQLLMGDFYGEWILCKQTLSKLASTAVKEDMSRMERLKITLTSTYAKLLEEAMEAREAKPNQTFGQDGITLLNNPVVVAAVYLDPRYFPMLSEEAKDIAEKALKDLYYDLKSQEPTAEAAANKQKEKAKEPAADSSRNLLRDLIKEKNQQRTILPLASDKDAIENQLLSYRNSLNYIDDLDVNILEWWSIKGVLIWPELYLLTRIVHAAPATQVTVERLFSMFKFVFSQPRYNLHPDRAEEIMLIRANMLFKAKELKKAGEYKLADRILADAEAFDKAILTASMSEGSSCTSTPSSGSTTSSS